MLVARKNNIYMYIVQEVTCSLLSVLQTGAVREGRKGENKHKCKAFFIVPKSDPSDGATGLERFGKSTSTSATEIIQSSRNGKIKCCQKADISSCTDLKVMHAEIK